MGLGSGFGFEPLEEVDLKHLSLRTVFLLALASAKRVTQKCTANVETTTKYRNALQIQKKQLNTETRCTEDMNKYTITLQVAQTTMETVSRRQAGNQIKYFWDFFSDLLWIFDFFTVGMCLKWQLHAGQKSRILSVILINLFFFLCVAFMCVMSLCKIVTFTFVFTN